MGFIFLQINFYPSVEILVIAFFSREQRELSSLVNSRIEAAIMKVSLSFSFSLPLFLSYNMYMYACP